MANDLPVARLLFVMFLVALIGAAAPSRAADKITLRHAMNSITAVNWPDFIASTIGFNEQQGLDVETVVLPAGATIAALSGGSVETSLVNATQLALAVDKGSDLVAVGVGGDNQPYHFMSAPAVKTFAELKGKTIAIAEATDIYSEVVRQILKKHGLDMDKDVNVMAGPGQNQRYASILNGAIQAGLFSLPADADLAQRGYHSLAYTPDYFPNLVISVNAVSRAWATAHPDVLRRFLLARANAIKWLYDPANESRAVQILVDRTRLPNADAQAAYDYYIRKAKVFPADGCIRRAGLDTLMHLLAEEHRLAKLGANDAGKLMDRRWCPR